MTKEQGFTPLALLLIITVLIALGYILISQGVIKIPSQLNPSNKQPTQSSSANLKNIYQNPFEKDTQYVNPFSEYKNPFDNVQ